MKASKETGWHVLEISEADGTSGRPPWVYCVLCRKAFGTVQDASASVCEVQHTRALASAQQALWTIKEVLDMKYEKVTPIDGPEAGKTVKRKIDAVEKLVRIGTVLHTFLSDELKEGIDDEAHNRIELAKISGRKPWQ